jgi:hypothetical protein
MSIKQLIVFVLLTGSFEAMAQRTKPAGDTVLKGSTIEVIQAYKPKVKQSPKPEWVPQLPPLDTTHPEFNYDVPQQTLYYTYNSLPLQPLALGRAQAKLPFPNYIKAGGGNLSTVFLDAGIGGIYGANYETGIHLHHIQQKGRIQHQETMLSGIEAETKIHNAKADWRLALDGSRNQYGYYGYNHMTYPDKAEDSIKQAYTNVKLDISMKNRLDSGEKFTYNPGIIGSIYRDRGDAAEASIGFNVPMVYDVDGALDLQIRVAGAVTRFTNNSQKISNNYIGAYPGLGIRAERLTGHIVAGLVRSMDNNYFLPDVQGTYVAKNNLFSVGAGWAASLLRNTYEELTSENPYMMNNYVVANGRRDEVFGQFYGRGGDHFTFSGRISWWSFENLPTFINKFTSANDWKYFNVSYQDVKAVSFQPGIRFNEANKWSVGVTGEFYSFYKKTEAYVWHTPSMKLKGDFIINPTPKLTCGAYLSMLGGIHAKDVYGDPVDVPAVFDLGGNAEYLIISRLSVFAQLNNLLNYKYQRWYKYEAYGINIYGGLRLKF